MRLFAFLCAAMALGFPGVALIATSGPTFTRDVRSGTVNADMPPERFRGNSVSVMVFTDGKGIAENCGEATPGFVIIACHRETKNGVSVIFMPNPCPVGDLERYAKILCHENAHNQGWSAEHEL